MKHDINQPDFTIVHLHFVEYLDKFHPVAVVVRVRETQLQVGENSS